MLHADHHGSVPHAAADAPTLSLLRLSAWQRLGGAGAILALLWAGMIAVIEVGR